MELKQNEYVLDVNDIIQNSEIEEEDLLEVFGNQYKFILAQAAQKTYLAMYSAYRGIHRDRQRKALQWMVINNDGNKEVMLRAQIEYVRSMLITGMDLQNYLQENSIEERMRNEVKHPKTVLEILRSGGLLFPSEVEYIDSELE